MSGSDRVILCPRWADDRCGAEHASLLAAAVQYSADAVGRRKCKERGEWPDTGDSPALEGERSTLCVRA